MSNENKTKIGPFLGFFVGFALAAVLAAAGVFVYVIPKLDSKHNEEITTLHTELAESKKVRIDSAKKLDEVATRAEEIDKSWSRKISGKRLSLIVRDVSKNLAP